MGAARKLVEYTTSDEYLNSVNQQLMEEKKMRRQSQKMIEVRAKQTGKFIKTVVLFGAIFICFAFVVFRQAQVYEAQYNVIELEREIKQTTMDIDEIKANLDSTVSIDSVERVAIQELSMQYPKPEQIVYIKSNWHYALDKTDEIKYGEKVKKGMKTSQSASLYEYFMKIAQQPSSSK